MESFLCFPSGYTAVGQYLFQGRNLHSHYYLGLFSWTIHLVETFLPIYMASSKFVLFLYPPLCLYVHLLIATICKFLLGEVCQGCLSAPNKAYQRPKNNAVPNERFP